MTKHLPNGQMYEQNTCRLSVLCGGDSLALCPRGIVIGTMNKAVLTFMYSYSRWLKH